jgi:transcriptional regulator with XRE-family HTH domain
MIRGFTTKKVNSYTLGEQLKKIRSEARLTLQDVSRETKIPVKYLTMIEEGQHEKLPPDVYVKGFLKSYAIFLGVDSQKLISLYLRDKDIKQHMGGENNNVHSSFKLAKIPRFTLTPKMVTIILALVIGIGGFYYLYREVGRFAAVPRLVVTNPIGDTSVAGNSISISGYTDQDAKLTINDQPVMVNDNGEFQENILLQEGLNKINVSSVNRFGKNASRILNIKSDYQKPDMAFNGDTANSNGKVNGDETAKKKGVEVVVRIDAFPTWLSIESDGGLVYSGTMLPGSTQSFQGEKEVRITSGKANQTFIKVNGKDEKIFDSNPGIVRDVVFTPSD